MMAELPNNRIVVADDDQDILDLVVFKLTQAGFDTMGFVDGVTALAAIEADPPRLAILDVVMPGLSGIDVLRQVRANLNTVQLRLHQCSLVACLERDGRSRSRIVGCRIWCRWGC